MPWLGWPLGLDLGSGSGSGSFATETTWGNKMRVRCLFIENQINHWPLWQAEEEEEAVAAAEPLVLDHSVEQLWGLAAGVVVAEVAEVQQTKRKVRIAYH